MDILCITGPTAAGKSASVAHIATHYPIEVINVDSATIYRGMDIGTAKPSRKEQSQIRHHLLDVLDPLERYSVGQFVSDTLRLIEEITARGHKPLLVGGTMMYLNALQKPLDELPEADHMLRAELDKEAAEKGWPALHARLATLDPETAARLAPQDSQRIQRALEICISSGKPMSSLLQQTDGTPAGSHHYRLISLEPSDRTKLHTRIAERFDAMLEAGLVDEVKALYARGDLSLDLPSIRCVGYRQFWPYVAGECDLAIAREQGIIATRHLAKRQMTWLRSMPHRAIIDCLSPGVPEQVLRHCARYWS